MFRKTPDPDVEYLAAEVLPALIGATIIGVVTDQPNGEEMGTAGIGLIVHVDGGHKVVWIDRDEEGNGPGWVKIEELHGANMQLRAIIK